MHRIVTDAAAGDAVLVTGDLIDDRAEDVASYSRALGALEAPLGVYMIPGNHDWYDGLTAFLRLFTQGRSIGGWRTEQKRSYWTIRLPHGWWMVGLDSQLDSYFDDPQLTYFEETLTAQSAAQGPELSAGAAAMNLLLATHAMGFVGGWITGWAAYSEIVRAAFCAPGERIAGFFFLGSPRLPLEERPRAPLAALVRHWSPPSA